MSYEQIAKTHPVARRAHICIWCPEPIDKGTKHVHEISKYEGEFQDMRWHAECLDAAHKYFKVEDSAEFEPHAHNRGALSEWTGARIIGHKTDSVQPGRKE